MLTRPWMRRQVPNIQSCLVFGNLSTALGYNLGRSSSSLDLKVGPGGWPRNQDCSSFKGQLMYYLFLSVWLPLDWRIYWWFSLLSHTLALSFSLFFSKSQCGRGKKRETHRGQSLPRADTSCWSDDVSIFPLPIDRRTDMKLVSAGLSCGPHLQSQVNNLARKRRHL